MSELKTEIMFDTNNCTSTISYWVNDVQKTMYTYKDGAITLSERTTEHENTFQGYIDGLDELSRWLGKLKIYRPPVHSPTEYSLELEFNNGVLHHTHYLNQSKRKKKKKHILMKACFYNETQTIKFFARPEITVSYSDFRIAIIQAKYFAQQAKSINQSSY